MGISSAVIINFLKKPQEITESRKECLKRIKNFDEMALLKEFHSLPIYAGEKGKGVERNAEFVRLMVSHLYYRALFAKDEGELQTLEEVLNKLSPSGEQQLVGEKQLKKYYSVGQSPIFKLIFYKEEFLCPKGKEEQKIVKELKEMFSKKVSLSPSQNILIENYCQQIEDYSQDKEKLQKEVLYFNDFSDNKDERIFQYSWKGIWAARFMGEKGLEAFCGNFSGLEERTNCSKEIMDIIQITNENRRDQITEIKNLICEARPEK